MKHRYLKDPQWYGAFVLAIVVWVLIHLFVEASNPQNLFAMPQIILISVILYPLLEEIVFRGMLQGQLMARPAFRIRFLGLSRANFLTSIIFSGLHLFYQPPLMAALIIFPSLVFGYFRDRHRTVVPSIYLHAFYNLGFLTLFAN